MGKNFHWTGKLLLYTQFIRESETKRHRETIEDFPFCQYVPKYFQESWLVE
jgi:hypothetical protein